jgi:D-alanine--poly(phosphoribitol) ligase subunit 2
MSLLFYRLYRHQRFRLIHTDIYKIPMVNDSRQQIHAKIVQLAGQLGRDARNLRFDEEIPATGLLDSAAIMELILWLEDAYGLTISQADLTIANFGAIDSISAYLTRAGVGPGS